jgi:dihydroxyacid dehydratase/phosphogluconate dehydratase
VEVNPHLTEWRDIADTGRELAAISPTFIIKISLSDARMSGTAYGTGVLHCSPEAAVGGPLAPVNNGDIVELNIASRKVNLLVSGEELDRRNKQFKDPELPQRG